MLAHKNPIPLTLTDQLKVSLQALENQIDKCVTRVNALMQTDLSIVEIYTSRVNKFNALRAQSQAFLQLLATAPLTEEFCTYAASLQVDLYARKAPALFYECGADAWYQIILGNFLLILEKADRTFNPPLGQQKTSRAAKRAQKKQSLLESKSEPHFLFQVTPIPEVDDEKFLFFKKVSVSHPKDVAHKLRIKDKENDLRLEKNAHYPHRTPQNFSNAKKLTVFGQLASRGESRRSFMADLDLQVVKSAYVEQHENDEIDIPDAQHSNASRP